MQPNAAQPSATPPSPMQPSATHRWLARPELAPLVGLLLVWSGFALAAGGAFVSLAGTAAWLNAAAPLGILALAVGLLMIGGEFDLSVGSIIGLSGMSIMLLTTQLHWPLTLAIPLTLALAAALGALNGLLAVRTRVPSFLITLGTMFVLRGLTIALTRLLTGRTQLSGLESARDYTSWRTILTHDLGAFHGELLWWLLLALAGAWLLRRTRAGNWIYAAGGSADAARSSGVPVRRTKVALFITTALAAALVGVLQALRYTGADALRGEGQEFRAIVAAVVGGTLLTGGYGSALGIAIGAIIFGMVQQGIVITGVDADWFQVFLGAMLVGAVLINNAVRARVLSR